MIFEVYYSIRIKPSEWKTPIADIINGYALRDEDNATDLLSWKDILTHYVKVDVFSTEETLTGLFEDFDMTQWLERIYIHHQGYNTQWGAEVQPMIRRLQTHTSMKVGDLIHCPDTGAWYIVRDLGFMQFEPSKKGGHI